MRTNTRIGAILLLNALAAILVAQNPPGRVVLGGRTLFTVQTSLGPFTPQERADHASVRLANVTRDLTVAVDQITLVNEDVTTEIVVGDRRRWSGGQHDR